MTCLPWLIVCTCGMSDWFIPVLPFRNKRTAGQGIAWLYAWGHFFDHRSVQINAIGFTPKSSLKARRPMRTQPSLEFPKFGGVWEKCSLIPVPQKKCSAFIYSHTSTKCELVHKHVFDVLAHCVFGVQHRTACIFGLHAFFTLQRQCLHKQLHPDNFRAFVLCLGKSHRDIMYHNDFIQTLFSGDDATSQVPFNIPIACGHIVRFGVVFGVAILSFDEVAHERLDFLHHVRGCCIFTQLCNVFCQHSVVTYTKFAAHNTVGQCAAKHIIFIVFCLCHVYGLAGRFSCACIHIYTKQCST